MAEYTKKLHIRKNSIVTDINLYTTSGEVGQNYLSLKDGSTPLYAKLGETSSSQASDLRIRKNGAVYAVLKTSVTLPNVVWIGSSATKVYKLDGDNNYASSNFAAPFYNMGPIAMDMDDNPWFFGRPSGTVPDVSIVKWNKDTNTGTKFYTFGKPYSYNPGMPAIDSQNNFWWVAYDTSSNGKLFMLSAASGYTAVTSYAVNAAPLQCVVDKEDNIWVTTYSNNRTHKFTKANGYTRTEYVTLSSPRRVAVDKDNNVWVTHGGVATLSRFNASNGYVRTDFAQLKKGASVAVDKNNNIIVGSIESNHVSRFNASNGYARTDYTVNGTNVPYLAVDRNNNIWTSYLNLGSKLDASNNYARIDYNYVGNYSHGIINPLKIIM